MPESMILKLALYFQKNEMNARVKEFFTRLMKAEVFVR
jgi:hypothetical protein